VCGFCVFHLASLHGLQSRNGHGKDLIKCFAVGTCKHGSHEHPAREQAAAIAGALQSNLETGVPTLIIGKQVIQALLDKLRASLQGN
jgi:hypothetical protein